MNTISLAIVWLAGAIAVASGQDTIAYINGPPLAQRLDVTGQGYTAFFRDVTLSHRQVVQLLHGADYVSIDDGAVIGQIILLK